MTASEELIDLLTKKGPVVAMLAPSFPIVFSYPSIVPHLKSLGFQHVVEVSAGAAGTNSAVIDLLKKDPKSRYITSPCPSLVRFVRKKYPALVKYLAMAADSPMVATTRIVQKLYPGHRPVFIGPCLVKKLEAAEDYPDLKILVVTFTEIKQVFEHFGINSDSTPVSKADFDIKESRTRLYPISGGLAQSSHIKDLLSKDQYMVVSGWQNCEKALEQFARDENIRLLDILYCEGGCINGGGIKSPLTPENRQSKIIAYWMSQYLS